MRLGPLPSFSIFQTRQDPAVSLAAAVIQYSRNIFAIKILRNYCVHISALQKYCKILRRDNIAPGCNIVGILLHTAIIV
jgi:hypothetical protein